ncbi:hypothetical protein ACLOJK_034948, partial [Asimina triloba]
SQTACGLCDPWRGGCRPGAYSPPPWPLRPSYRRRGATADFSAGTNQGQSSKSKGLQRQERMKRLQEGSLNYKLHTASAPITADPRSTIRWCSIFLNKLPYGASMAAHNRPPFCKSTGHRPVSNEPHRRPASNTPPRPTASSTSVPDLHDSPKIGTQQDRQSGIDRVSKPWQTHHEPTMISDANQSPTPDLRVVDQQIQDPSRQAAFSHDPVASPDRHQQRSLNLSIQHRPWQPISSDPSCRAAHLKQSGHGQHHSIKGTGSSENRASSVRSRTSFVSRPQPAISTIQPDRPLQIRVTPGPTKSAPSQCNGSILQMRRPAVIRTIQLSMISGSSCADAQIGCNLQRQGASVHGDSVVPHHRYGGRKGHGDGPRVLGWHPPCHGVPRPIGGPIVLLKFLPKIRQHLPCK